MKKIFLIILLFMIFSYGYTAVALQDIYSDQAQQSGVGDLSSVLPEDTQDILSELDVTQINWIDNLTPQTVFHVFSSLLKSNAKGIITPCCSVIGLIILFSFLHYFSSSSVDTTIVGYVSVLGVCVLLIYPFVSVITAVTKAVQSGCVFMSSFIPVYCGILVSGGRVATSTGFSLSMLGATQIVSFIASFVVLPLASMYLAIRICFSFAPSFSINGLANAVKKGAMWVLSLILLLFLGVLKIQTVIHTATDSLSVSTAKFVVGTTVPLVGSAVGEAITSVSGCISMLSSSVGMYGIIAYAALFLPVFIQLLLWKLGVGLAIGVSDIFAHSKISEILKGVEETLSILIAVLACSAIFFVISITIVCIGGKV